MLGFRRRHGTRWKIASSVQPLLSHRQISGWLTPGVRIGALILVLISYFFAVFWPLEWRLPRQQPNDVAFDTAGHPIFDRPGILRTYGSTDWMTEIIHGAPLQVYLVVVPGPPHPRFAGRILAFTTGSFGRLLTIDRDHRDLVIHLRGPDTDDNGNPPLRVADVFELGRMTTIDLHLIDRQLTVAVDGVDRLGFPFRYDPRRDWDEGYDVTLGADLNIRRFFLGKVLAAVVTVGSRRIDLLKPLVLSRPRRMFFLSRDPRLTVVLDFDRKDAVQNVIGFIPLGVIAAIWPGATVFSVLATGMAVSGTIEFTQLSVPGRVPSVDDILTNTTGALVGWLLVFLLRLALDWWSDDRRRIKL